MGLDVGFICDKTTEDDFARKVFSELETLCSLGSKRIAMSRLPGMSDVRAMNAISEFCETAKPTVIHGHGAKGGAYARLLAGRLNAKAIYTPHGGSLHYGSTSPAGAVFLGLEKILRRCTDGLIFESQFSADTYAKKIGAYPSSHRVIHNGLKEHEFDCWSDKNADYDFVFVGEMRLLKGVDVLLDAIAEISQQRSLKVLLVGAGPDKEYFEQRIATLNLADYVTLSPPIFPATDAFNQGKCVVMPSLAESFPYIVLETAAAGCPLIATNVGGIPEIFGPAKDKLLPAGDAKVLATAMLSAMDDPQQALDTSKVIQAYVRSEFSMEKMTNEIVAYYEQLLGTNELIPEVS